MNELALFAGAGGGLLGGKLLGWRTVCAVEFDPYARSVLMARQNDGCLEPFPIWGDVCTFDGRPWRGCVDVVSGGFPCQDISTAGKGAGVTGERSGLWREMARIIGEVGPRFVFVENSPALTSRGLGVVLGDLAELGFDAEWGVLGAVHAGAPHRRNRIWIVANACGRRCSEPDRREIQQPRGAEIVCASSDVANADGAGCEWARPAQPTQRDDAAQPAGTSADVADAIGNGWEQRRTESARRQGGLATEQCGSSLPIWQPCDCCDDFFCILHGCHTAQCDCPPIEEWGDVDPYSHPVGQRLEGQQQGGPASWPVDRSGDGRDRGWWATEPDVGRVAHGVAHRVDRLRCLGNGQVPAVVRLAWHTLTAPRS